MINQLDWQEFTSQFAEEIILASKNTSFHVLRLHHCKVFNNTYLQHLIPNSLHLTEISLRNCKNIKDNVGPLFEKCPRLEIIMSNNINKPHHHIKQNALCRITAS